MDLSAAMFQRGIATRDIVQDMYIRKVEKKDGQLWNIEFDVIKQMKDPGKSK